MVTDEIVLSMIVLKAEKGWKASDVVRVIEGYTEHEVGFVEGVMEVEVAVEVAGHWELGVGAEVARKE